MASTVVVLFSFSTPSEYLLSHNMRYSQNHVFTTRINRIKPVLTLFYVGTHICMSNLFNHLSFY